MERSESVSTFLNRSAHPKIIEVRDRLQSWFERFPVEARQDLRERFRRDDDHTYHGAVFELLVHELLVRLGCTVEVHPEIPGTGSRPDFLARHGDCPFYVEATVVNPKRSLSASRPLEDDVVAKINQLESLHFRILARVEGELPRALSRRQVIEPFANLLRGPPIQMMSSVWSTWLGHMRHLLQGSSVEHGACKAGWCRFLGKSAEMKNPRPS